jgi:hypothetical protein
MSTLARFPLDDFDRLVATSIEVGGQTPSRWGIVWSGFLAIAGRLG